MAVTKATSALYRGFSTASHLDNGAKTFSTADVETIKRDLLNHIYTIPGERVMMPTFGTRIPLLAFEPLDEETVKIIDEDLRRVIDYDPRVRLIDLAILPLPDNNAIVTLVDVLYVELGFSETLRLEFAVGS